jgi:hypothetical protein
MNGELDKQIVNIICIIRGIALCPEGPTELHVCISNHIFNHLWDFGALGMAPYFGLERLFPFSCTETDPMLGAYQIKVNGEIKDLEPLLHF